MNYLYLHFFTTKLDQFFLWNIYLRNTIERLRFSDGKSFRTRHHATMRTALHYRIFRTVLYLLSLLSVSVWTARWRIVPWRLTANGCFLLFARVRLLRRADVWQSLWSPFGGWVTQTAERVHSVSNWRVGESQATGVTTGNTEMDDQTAVQCDHRHSHSNKPTAKANPYHLQLCLNPYTLSRWLTGEGSIGAAEKPQP